MKKKLLLSFSLLFSSMFSLCNCGIIEYEIKEDGYFKYVILGKEYKYHETDDKEAIALVGLTEEGLSLESVDIPKSIQNIPVRYLGYKNPNNTLFGNHDYIDFICGEKLRKIYFFDNISTIFFVSGPQVDLFNCSRKKIGAGGTYNKIYFEKSFCNELGYDEERNLYFFPSNVTFLNNFDSSDKSIYRIENVEVGESIPFPLNPTRDKYEFTGWYTEASCENLWDFSIIRQTDDFDLTLYSGWNEN